MPGVYRDSKTLLEELCQIHNQPLITREPAGRKRLAGFSLKAWLQAKAGICIKNLLNI